MFFLCSFLKAGVVIKAFYLKLTLCHNAFWISLGVVSLRVFGNKSVRSTPNSAVACDHKGSTTPYTAKGSAVAHACYARVSSRQLSSEKDTIINWTFRLTLEKFSKSSLSYDSRFCFNCRAVVIGNHSYTK